MVADAVVAVIVSTATTAILLTLSKSKCFVRRIHSGLQWGIGFTERPLVENELSLPSEDIAND